MILVSLQTASSRQPPSLLLRCVGPPARLRFGVYSLGVLQSRCNGAAPLGTPSVLLGARRTDPAPVSERGRAGTGCTAQGGGWMLSTGARVPPACHRRRWPRLGAVPPFPSPSGAAVPERLLVQVRGCARPHRLPGLVVELLSFRHGVQAGGGPAGLARLGAPVREGRRGAGWQPDPSFCWFCSPPSLRVPNSWGPGAAPHGIREALGKRRSLGLLCPPSGQAVPKCPPPRAAGAGTGGRAVCPR